MGVLDLFKLDGKVALVTGASRGLGAAMARALAEAGADIAACARSDMGELQREVERVGRRCETFPFDVADTDRLEELVADVVDRLGALHVLVNNAGLCRRAPFTEFTEKDWDDVIQVNLKSVFVLSQAAARVFIQQGTGGKIINIASMLSYQGGIRVPSYTASKSGVLGLTRLMATELAPQRINVNGIAPGYMRTAITEPLQKDPERSVDILRRIPAGRWGEPEDLMGVVVFLASEASSYMNGETVAVDGGWLCR
jgi:2-deoxy-D-gluconate 3-dehydrogenase